MTDEQLDAIIEAAKPNLRTAIRQTTEQKQLAMMLNLGMVTFSNKQTWNVSCFVMTEPMAELVGPLIMHGVPNMIQAQMKPHMKPGEAPPSPAQPAQPPKRGGFSIPGA